MGLWGGGGLVLDRRLSAVNWRSSRSAGWPTLDWTARSAGFPGDSPAPPAGESASSRSARRPGAIEGDRPAPPAGEWAFIAGGWGVGVRGRFGPRSWGRRFGRAPLRPGPIGIAAAAPGARTGQIPAPTFRAHLPGADDCRTQSPRRSFRLGPDPRRSDPPPRAARKAYLQRPKSERGDLCSQQPGILTPMPGKGFQADEPRDFQVPDRTRTITTTARRPSQ